MEGGPCVSEMFTHIHHERMVSVFEDAPEFAGNVPDEVCFSSSVKTSGWSSVTLLRIAQMLNESAKAVRNAVKSRVEQAGT
jgi:hypothetical protein